MDEPYRMLEQLRPPTTATLSNQDALALGCHVDTGSGKILVIRHTFFHARLEELGYVESKSRS